MSRDILRMLEQAGFALVRANKHFVFRRGADMITVARTPRSGSGNQKDWVRQEIARRDRAARAA